MATLSAVFPAFKFSPDLYYTFLEDLREDAFIGGVTKLCREVTELYPNTNLVALIREKSEEFFKQRAEQKKLAEQKKALGYEEPDYEEIEKAKKDWNELRDRLAREKDMNNEAKKREGKL